MAKKEIYRSFDGLLNVDNQSGYILYNVNGGELVEYESVSVWQGVNTERARIPAALIKDYSDMDTLAELVAACWYGALDGGQIWFRGKWWNSDKIREIQAKNRDNNWQRYV